MLIYSHPNSLLVFNARNILQAQSLKVILKNEFSAGAAGGLPPTDHWLELWLYEEKHFVMATKLLAEMQSQALEEDWLCKQCGEFNGTSFDWCWNCSE